MMMMTMMYYYYYCYTLYYHACKYGAVSILNYALYSTGTVSVYLRLTIVNTTVLSTLRYRYWGVQHECAARSS